MPVFDFRRPPEGGGAEALREYLDLLLEELTYTLNNLDDENVTADFLDKLGKLAEPEKKSVGEDIIFEKVSSPLSRGNDVNVQGEKIEKHNLFIVTTVYLNGNIQVKRDVLCMKKGNNIVGSWQENGVGTNDDLILDERYIEFTLSNEKLKLTRAERHSGSVSNVVVSNLKAERMISVI